MNEVWEDKIKIRQRLKLESKKYQKFWAEHEKEFRLFWAQMPIENKRKLFQMPQEELHSMIAQENDFKEAYRVLMLALVEQLRYWEKTLYPSDGIFLSCFGFLFLLGFSLLAFSWMLLLLLLLLIVFLPCCLFICL